MHGDDELRDPDPVDLLTPSPPPDATTEAPLRQWAAALSAMVAAGGPRPSQYPQVRAWIDEVGQAILDGRLGPDEADALRRMAGRSMGPGTLQGRAWLKPMGYAGDFRIIDDIYCRTTSEDPALAAWDRFFHEQPAVKAVRNRKDYFKGLIRQLAQQRPGQPLRVLNLACGPCRDVAELMDEAPDLPVHFTCVDMDERALAHGRALCAGDPARVHFLQANALRLRLPERFDLVWSAGLLDYFDDRGFVRVVTRLVGHARPDTGEVVVGNFGDGNPSRPYQTWTDWLLEHRGEERLRALGRACGLADRGIVVEREPEGVNLFLRLRPGR